MTSSIEVTSCTNVGAIVVSMKTVSEAMYKMKR